MVKLLLARRFGPLFAAQFLGAFNDNLFRTAVIFMITYQLSAGEPDRAALLATLATGLFILPYVLFGGLAGDIADKRDKTVVARWVKLAEIAIMAVGTIALWTSSLPLLLATVFLMGAHSTIFGPIKYAVLPQHLRSNELLAGTGLVEGGTFLAILLGQIAGGLLEPRLIGPVTLLVATLGWLAARGMPLAPPVDATAIDWNPLTSTRRAMAGAFIDRRMLAATCTIGWFWAIGAIFTTQFVPLARNVFGGIEAVATLFLGAFSIGIAVGSAAIGRLLGGTVDTRWCAPALIVMALATTDFFFAGRALAATGPVGDVAGFLARSAGLRILFDLIVLSIAGGVLSVPLYGVLQTSLPNGRARTIAANNIVNSCFQAGGVFAVGAAVSNGVGILPALLAAGLTSLLLVPLLAGLSRH